MDYHFFLPFNWLICIVYGGWGGCRGRVYPTWWSYGLFFFVDVGGDSVLLLYYEFRIIVVRRNVISKIS